MSPVPHVSEMGTINADSPGLDSYNRIPKLSDTKRIITKAANYTCLPEESGSVYTQTAAVVFTLPNAVSYPGWHAWFVNKADADMTITSDPADKLVADGDAAADSVAFSTSSHKIGGVVHVCSDGANWLILSVGNLSAVPTYAT